MSEADFAAAQKHILARRQAREAAEASETAIRQQQIINQLNIPLSIHSLSQHAIQFYDFLSRSNGSRPAFRVGQVDAELLDEELLELLSKQVGEGLSLFGQHLKSEYAAEIGVILRAILWKLSIWDHSASYGASLQGLQYMDAREANLAARTSPSRWQKIAYGVLTVGGRYAWTTWEEYLSNQENGYDDSLPRTRLLSRITTMCSATHDVAALASFLVFLYNGKYRSLTDRLLRMRLVPSSNQTSREVSFEYLNRQLVWHAFTEFLLFLLPLVGISRWKRWIARAWKKTKRSFQLLRAGETREKDDDQVRGELAFLPETTCAICYHEQNAEGTKSEQDVISAGANAGIIGNAFTDITNPYEAIPCGCIYCYVCLAQQIEAEAGEGWICLRCGELIKECKPWNGDVLQTTVEESEDEDGNVNEKRMSMSLIDPMPVEDDEGQAHQIT
ncbi:peroxisomal biogenesis factor 2 [Piedraia hortae CBS 480.64]|uniref:RING-type E3 ubiquitin transferase (cysteine targeting) n=1 Tax=Piedraia hortae CBS 480.64 TaxID=1314780 RepID=A0A6A7BUU3_9PEZI|nr:peroxisomal biogenesis factor 2 [Piedraia hortae CBS 480.64]